MSEGTGHGAALSRAATDEQGARVPLRRSNENNYEPDGRVVRVLIAGSRERQLAGMACLRDGEGATFVPHQVAVLHCAAR